MAESQPQPEGPINAGTTTTATTTAATVPVSTNNHNHNHHYLGPSLAPKRQRRPSVRLGEIGNQPATVSYDSHARRPKPWRFHKDPSLAAKASKTRPLTNLVNGGGDCHGTLETEDNLDYGNRKPKELKSQRPTKRVRTNWAASKGDDSREDNNVEEEFRDFETGGSESPLKEQSPVHSIDNVALDYWRRPPVRARVSESHDRDDGMPESDSRDRKCGTSGERNFVSGRERGRNRFLDEGVRNWLYGLGLGRYAPVFEIHEVDDEVLPMLTLEDLKDMGINAVGSRRKMYTAIQKLHNGFS
uniref:SAM domain-containing protein n=1 Tax=Davidia involucrata TaxID=16924 RepID=A0A5B7BUR7_DAVIN